MQYPTILEYVKAIQDAGDNLDKLAYLIPVLDEHGEPYHISGVFAVVFKMEDKSTGKYYALKCFAEEREGRTDAYRQIAEELDMVESLYVTSVKYLEKELFVPCQSEEKRFPVLLMDWVDGETMGAYIAANYQNQFVMSMLCYRFCVMAAWIRSQSFAHGDINPDNIIVRPNGSLVLVDYDGMFVPSMKGCKSPTIGTKDFCHPLRTVDDFDETIDDFSLASIALSLKAISMNSTLLDTYGASDRLLFSEKDYRNPSNSKVISALQGLMCDKDFCTLYSLFMLALARKELSACSFRLFIGEKPILLQTIEDLSTKATEEELKDAYIDEWGVKYSKDGRKLLKAIQELKGDYSVKEGTKTICICAFFNCSSLNTILIPISVTSIGNSAFLGCTSLTNVVISNSVTCIEAYSFAGCSSLTRIIIPDSIICIRDGAFSGCSSLTRIVIPDSITSIGDGAFAGCSSLKTIIIPKGVVCLNGNPFYGWNGRIECFSPNFIYEDDMLFDKDKNKIISFRKHKAKIFFVPNNVKSIGDSAFRKCSFLTNISIPSSVTNIGENAFEDCTSLTDIIIPNNVSCICDSAFSGCSSLTSIVIPNSVTSIGKNAFEDCSSLTDIIIPDRVTGIEYSAFENCTSLVNVVIPDSVTSIGDCAFFGCTSLVNIVIPDSVTSIGDCAFSGCTSLVNIVIPDSVTSIGDCAFSGCTSLVNIVIPDSVTNIEDNAFSGCISLKNIIIPNSVTNIEDNVFLDCSSLTSVDIPNSVTSIGQSAFENCSFLNNVVIPNSVTTIAEFAFFGCDFLSEIVIPDSVNGIGDRAFAYCDFPSDLKKELISRFGDKIFE